MHRNLLRASARIAVLGGIVTLGLGSTQTALAVPSSTFVPCDASLSTAISDAGPGAVLTLAPWCTYWLTAGLPVINKTLTIVGHHTSITRSYADATPSFSIFWVRHPGNLTLDDVNVRNGDGNGNGGAISNVDAIVTINGGTFSDNNAYRDGGAIYNDDGTGTLTINGAKFHDNHANGDGGAIYNVDGSSVTIHGGTFSDNDASANGGAIYNDSALTVDDVIFTRNGSVNGGAIYSFHVDPTINGGTFLLNYASGDGGAIFNGETMTVTHAMMYLNTADYGGSVYNDASGTVNLTGDLVMFNQASEADGGGGVYNDNGGTVNLSGGMIKLNTPDNCSGTVAGC